MKAITVRLADEVHRRVKVRAAQDGVAMESLGRGWFETYADGGMLVAGGLAAGDSPEVETLRVQGGQPMAQHGGKSQPTDPMAPATSLSAPAAKPFVPDWKKGKK